MRGMRLFSASLLIYTLTHEAAMVAISFDKTKDAGTVAGAAGMIPFMTWLLWYCARRGDLWPRRTLLIFLIIGIGFQVALLNAKSLLALGDMAALALLLKGWSDMEGDRRPSD
jgi:hypothetical protein